MKQDIHALRSRLPKGIAAKNPIHVRLSDDERAALEAIAAKESRSISSMARLVLLAGVKSFQVE
ncbi:hypothetical protein C9426_10040 [Serratia sp. S1B]|nr:hypothetical protein C9426_10040 [Serratia sp. S1B]